MTATRQILIASVVALGAAGCGTSIPTSPSALGVAPGTLGVTESSAGMAAAAASCTVAVGATNHPLPAFHEFVDWLSTSVAASDLTCGQVNSLDVKMDSLAEALDSNPPAFERACGVSTSAAREIDALTRTGQLAVVTFPAPFPGGPTTAQQIAHGLSEIWCAAARGDITGPRS